MNPTEAELNAINTLGEVSDWAGLEDDLRDLLLEKLGKPTKLRDLAFMSRQTWERTGGTFAHAGSRRWWGSSYRKGAEHSGGVSHRDLQQGGLAEVGHHPASSIPTAMVGGGILPAAGTNPSPTAPASPTRRFKLSTILDPTLDAEVVQLDSTEIQAMYCGFRGCCP